MSPSIEHLYNELAMLVDRLVLLTRMAERGQIEWTDRRIKALREPVLEMTSRLQAAIALDIARDPE